MKKIMEKPNCLKKSSKIDERMRYYSKISSKLKTLGLTTIRRSTEIETGMESFGFCIIGILISYLLHVICLMVCLLLCQNKRTYSISSVTFLIIKNKNILVGRENMQILNTSMILDMNASEN
jgi:hypothetical protein